MTDVALVTGSTNNVGEAIARGLSADGYQVVVTSRHGDEAEAVAADLPNGGSGFEVDLSVPEEIEDLFAFVDDRLGRIHVLVNSVAHTENESILECDLETWEYTIATNLRSYYLCTRAAARRMVANGGGSIVNVTLSRRSGRPSKFSYSVSKGGVNFLTRCAAHDLAPHGVRVNAVGSGIVGTPVGHADAAGRTYVNDRIPIGHVGEPGDVANAVRFLVSEDAKHVVGAKLEVDGGKEA